MGIISIVGPKGGIGKTTLSINTTAALVRCLKKANKNERVCLADLDLRLPTISNMLASHCLRSFFDLFETIANRTYQVEFLRTFHKIYSAFAGYLAGTIPENSRELAKMLAIYKNLNLDLVNFSGIRFGEQIHQVFSHRGKIQTPANLKTLGPSLKAINPADLKTMVAHHESNSRPALKDYVNYIDEYGFSIIGGEVPVLGKRMHSRRINEPGYLVHLLEFLNKVFAQFDHVILDTPAGGVNHLSSLMNSIDQVLFVFDMSSLVAIEGSIDALHSFIDYYEEFYNDFTRGRLKGLDKVYVNRLVSAHGHHALAESLKNRKMGILFNRCNRWREISNCLNRLRDYLSTLNQYENFKDRIHIVGMLPQNKIVNLTTNRGTLFYRKDNGLSGHMDQIAQNILGENRDCPTLVNDNKTILEYLKKKTRTDYIADNPHSHSRVRVSSGSG